MTQEYTPVSWQDETTSQQGTLINAERLNQMQTAHHYADGFEEVDTAPTADPGVAYHKIVYCTADSTFYRWDGTQWTADIDDDTKRLLEEHEADHDNPHQVTKAQVGLGNADNTSDADKPISTATQTALNAKADKSDTYTKAQTDTLLGGKVDKQDSSAGMIAYTAEEGTEGSTEINAGAKPATIPIRTADGRLRAYFDDADPYADDCVTYAWTSGQLADIRGTLDYKADKATTLAGYGITDAYTKTEADTLLGAKADTATTYTKSEVQTYVSNALNGYLPMVRTTGNQNIDGVKTFLKEIDGLLKFRWYTSVGTNAGKWMKVATMPSNMLRFEGAINTRYELIEFTGSSADVFIRTTGVNIDAEQKLRVVVESDGTFTLWLQLISNYQAYYLMDLRAFRYGSQLAVTISTDTAMYDTPTAGASQYDSQAMPQAVHRSGAETIAGAKTFTGQMLATGQRAYSAGNTSDVATIGTLDAYTPMVRTTGNQDIGGIKTFTDPPAGHRTNSRTNAYAGYYTIMKLGLRGDGTNRQILGGLISQHFGMIQINEPNATSINVTDLMGTFSSLLDFALYTDGSYHYVAVKQKTNNTFAYELALMAANKGNYGLNSGDIQVYYTLSAVDSNWTLVASTEGA